MFKTLLKPLVLVIATSLSYSFTGLADTGLWKYENGLAIFKSNLGISGRNIINNIKNIKDEKY